MSLNPEQVARIARLARIELSTAEAEATLDQLNGILGFIEQLQSVNTDGIAPMAHAVDVMQRLREDKAIEVSGAQLKAFQSIAPEVEAGLYLVPKVIE